jgi:hypothetical protein
MKKPEPNPMMTGEHDLRNQYVTKWSALETERSSWDQHWRDLSEFLLPRRSRWQTTDRNRGAKKNDKIIDSTATFALRALSAGFMSGVTSPSRPWFKIETPDPALNARHDVQMWLEEVRKVMADIHTRSNLYTALPVCYQDLGCFGTHAMMVLEDDEDVMRFHSLPIGSYVLATSSRGTVDTIMRRYAMTARQMVEEFGIDNVSENVKSNVLNGMNAEAWHDVVHVVCPNKQYQRGKIGPAGKKWSSDYFEWGTGEIGKPFLKRGGFDFFPVLAPRWTTNGEDVYGESPAMDVLGDVRALQLLQRRKAQAIEKIINPPLKGPSALLGKGISLLPGAFNAYDGQGDGLSSVYDMNFPIDGVLQDSNERRLAIREAFFNDLFRMLTNSDRREITATEIQAKEQERMLQLGPALERQNDELLDPLIDMTFAMALRRGMIPPPPPVLEGLELKIEYVSIMAQAQKMLGIGAVDRYMGFVGNLSAVQPDIIDGVDMDVAAKEYGMMLGVSPKILRDEDTIIAIRQGRAQAAQQQQQTEQAQVAAQSAKILSETDTQRPSALQEVIAAQ